MVLRPDKKHRDFVQNDKDSQNFIKLMALGVSLSPTILRYSYIRPIAQEIKP